VVGQFRFAAKLDAARFGAVASLVPRRATGHASGARTTGCRRPPISVPFGVGP
jgi:hypothetical protein